jgi:sedoheptulokinase
MKAIGIDLGTTSICGVLIESRSEKLLKSVTKSNTAALQTDQPFERLQDVGIIVSIAQEIIAQFCSEESGIEVIGITGQMHGVLYIDKDGKAVSPLYTWQDESGKQVNNERVSYVDALAEETGYALYSGYGCVTYYFHLMKEKVPLTACGICTIGDYLAMQLTNEKVPIIHSSNADSLGCYLTMQKSFDLKALAGVGMDKTFFPQVESGYRLVGRTSKGVGVSCAIGDNQASFLGAVKDMEHSILINVGTGSQISVMAKNNVTVTGKRTNIRPCIADRNLLVGASLCGGKAYSILEQFFQSVIELSNQRSVKNIYDQMEEAGFLAWEEKNHLLISTKFCGTRQNSKERGSILNIAPSNWKAGPVVVGFLEGIANELLEMYSEMEGKTFDKSTVLVGSGNGMRKNKLLQKICAELFHLPVQIPLHDEEAAYGAALYSLVCAGAFQTIEQAQESITYL